MQIKHPQYLGQKLLQKGFRTWFKYMFKCIEGSKFIEEGLHKTLFDQFDRIYQLKDIRVTVNIPPRSGKTTMARYFLAYCWAINSKSNFIYTSFSQSLLSDISRSLLDILEHPIYQAMYSKSIQVNDIEDSPVDEFWKKYLEKSRKDGKIKYTIRKIISPLGGVILFASIGSSITGFGAGLRNGKGFTGALIIDDANKPADINSEIMRNKVVTYYEGTLLSRLNNPNVSIVNIQQRLHVEDLSAILKDKYKFQTLIRPLIDENGECQLPSQYTEERIKELKVNSMVFQSQYQQEPEPDNGLLFSIEWFKRYINKPLNGRIIQSWDTAVKADQLNDFSVCTTWMISDLKYYLIDVFAERLEYPNLKKQVIYQSKLYAPDTILIEDKASGQSLIQDLRNESKMPIVAILPKDDKITRASTISAIVESGNVAIPEKADWLYDFENEVKMFPNGKHDDRVDSMTQFLNWSRMQLDDTPSIRSL